MDKFICLICKCEFTESEMKREGLCLDCAANESCPTCKSAHSVYNAGEQSFCKKCGDTFPSIIFSEREKPEVFNGEILLLCECGTLLKEHMFFVDPLNDVMYLNFECKNCEKEIYKQLIFK